MKKFACIMALAAVCSHSFAQQQPLREAVNRIKATKGFISRGVSSDKIRDSKDSLCTLSITDFQIQVKGCSPARLKKTTDILISQILACYEADAANSSSSHSYVVSSDSSSLPGYKTVKMYYGEGRSPYTSEKGHSYVSVRKDVGTDGYRQATCIEWWRNAAQEFLGRIVEVKGPFNADVYEKRGSDSKLVIQTPPLSPTWYRDALQQVSEIGELANMWRETDDADRKIALEESTNLRLQEILKLMSFHEFDSCNVVITRALRSLSKINSYKAKVILQNPVFYGPNEIQELDMTVSQLARAYHDMDLVSARIKYPERLIHLVVNVNSVDKEGPSLIIPRISSVSPETYKDFHTVCCVLDEGEEYSNCAIWTTADSTYVVRSYNIPDDHTMLVQNPQCYIRNSRTGDIYHKIRNEGVSDEYEFYVDGMAGKTIAITEVYPAIPQSCTLIDLEPAFAVRGHEEDSKRLEKIKVADMQAKQVQYTSTPMVILKGK